MQQQEGLKHDTGKPPMALLPWGALEEVSKVFGFGATKYGPHNWKHGLSNMRTLSAALRHISAYLQGENYDHETHLHPLAHAVAELLMTIELELMYGGKYDERFLGPEH